MGRDHDDHSAGSAAANLFTTCAEAGADSACAGGRLAVPAARLDAFYDILAADVRNPSKTGLLSALAAGVFDPLDFIRRPGEHLSLAFGVSGVGARAPQPP